MIIKREMTEVKKFENGRELGMKELEAVSGGGFFDVVVDCIETVVGETVDRLFGSSDNSGDGGASGNW